MIIPEIFLGSFWGLGGVIVTLSNSDKIWLIFEVKWVKIWLYSFGV